VPKFEKGNRAFVGAKGQGKSSLPTDIPAKYSEGFLEEMDGRTEISRNLRHRLNALVSDLGGFDGLSYQERSLCKRVIHLERQVERFENTLVQGGSVDYTQYFSMINTLSGLFSKIGTKRRIRPISLSDYMRDKQTINPGGTRDGNS
jgi:hypothetical protein